MLSRRGAALALGHGKRFLTTSPVLLQQQPVPPPPPPGPMPPYPFYPDPYYSPPSPPSLMKQLPGKPAHEYVRKPPFNKGINIVPQGELWVIERLGKYHVTLEPGLGLLIPLVDRIAYVHSSKEQGHEIPNQSAITKDNVVVHIDGILFLRIIDARMASYNIDNPVYNLINVAQTTMRSEIGKLTLDKLFEERTTLNKNIREAISVDAEEWGIECKRYEIRDIQVSDIVRKSMDLQAQADRHKRKVVLESEGDRDAMTNRAIGEKRVTELIAEAEKRAAILKAEGDAEAVRITAAAQATSIDLVSKAMEINPKSTEAVGIDVARRYVDSFGKIAQEGNTVLLPANLNDPAGMITSALSIFGAVNRDRKTNQVKKEEKESTV